MSRSPALDLANLTNSKPTKNSRRTKAPMAAIRQLPTEIWLEILKTLPYMSLQNMQRVSKLFPPLLASPIFDRALFRVRDPWSVELWNETARTDGLQIHPVLADLASYLDYKEPNRRGSSTWQLKKTTRKLEETSFATESATWPPVACGLDGAGFPAFSSQKQLHLLTVKELIKRPFLWDPDHSRRPQPLWYDGVFSVPGRGLDALPNRVLLEPVWLEAEEP